MEINIDRTLVDHGIFHFQEFNFYVKNFRDLQFIIYLEVLRIRTYMYWAARFAGTP